MTPVAVYVHIPFCPTKCGYCDFNSYAMSGEIVDRTVAAIHSEMANSPWRGRPAKTVFFGGGTPTFISGEELVDLLQVVLDVHPPVHECEITSEANPGTVDASKFETMLRGGFNRLSIGVQSFEPGDLLRLGRAHSSSEAEKAVRVARSAGFKNLNIDLMFALPEQSSAAWQENLCRAVSLDTDHISLYCLTIEPNTAFHKMFAQGKITQPSEDAQIEMYEMCGEFLGESGYARYEISNYCKPNFECKHNLEYWRGEEYAAYGPGAVSRMGDVRTMRWKQPVKYCEAVEVGTSLLQESESLSQVDVNREAIMLGLRLTEGVSAAILNLEKLKQVFAKGWIETVGPNVRLTKAGRHFCNQAIVELF